MNYIIPLIHTIFNYFLSTPNTYMTRGARSEEKPEQISMRMPKELVVKVDALKEKEGVDRSIIINKAVRYWTSVNGNIISDNEILTRLNTIENTTYELQKQIEQNTINFMKEKEQLLELVNKQQNTIDTLLSMVSKK